MNVTVTIPLLPILIYLAVGLVLWLPLECLAWMVARRRGWSLTTPMRAAIKRGVRRNPARPLLAMALWPVMAWEIWDVWRGGR